MHRLSIRILQSNGMEESSIRGSAVTEQCDACARNSYDCLDRSGIKMAYICMFSCYSNVARVGMHILSAIQLSPHFKQVQSDVSPHEPVNWETTALGFVPRILPNNTEK